MPENSCKERSEVRLEVVREWLHEQGATIEVYLPNPKVSNYLNVTIQYPDLTIDQIVIRFGCRKRLSRWAKLGAKALFVIVTLFAAALQIAQAF